MSSKLIKEYLSFTRKERIAIILLVGIILLIYFLPPLISSPSSTPNTQEIAQFNAIKKALDRDPYDSTASPDPSEMKWMERFPKNKTEKPSLFYFDPNSIDLQEWQRLGVKQRTAITIQRYLSKGGKFRKAEDLSKVYGLSEGDYFRLRPFVRIKNASNNIPLHMGHDSGASFSARQTKTKERSYLIELNSTDTAALIRLPGIGNKLANRIIKFRDRLGGFYSIEQVGETYGLPDSTYQKIKSFLILGNAPLVHININETDVATLRQHPYITWALANALVEFRRQHGPIKNLEELEGIGAISPDQLKKLIPYLSTY